MPIQIYWKFNHHENEKFQIKNSNIFHISAQNLDCEYSLELPQKAVLTSTHNLCFWTEIRKIMYTPVNPSFTIQKWGLRESKLYRHVFVMCWMSGKQCRPWLAATFCGMWSWSTLFAQACLSKYLGLLRYKQHWSSSSSTDEDHQYLSNEISWLSLSRPHLSRITAYLKVKIWSLPKHKNLTTGKKILWKRGEIAPQGQFLLFSTIFSIYL